MRLGSLIIILSLIMIEVPAVAGHQVARPTHFDLRELIKASLHFLKGNTHQINAILTKLEQKESADRICICEIMELRNNNIRVSDIAVFAERTNYGDLGRDYKIAERLIKKEKKQMKSAFFDHIKVSTRIAVATDCLSLYMKLQQETSGLQLYDILDAGVRAAR